MCHKGAGRTRHRCPEAWAAHKYDLNFGIGVLLHIYWTTTVGTHGFSLNVKMVMFGRYVFFCSILAANFLAVPHAPFRLLIFIFCPQAVNTIRVLAADIVQKSMSGHPGAPMGMAPMAHVLFSQVRFLHTYVPPKKW